MSRAGIDVFQVAYLLWLGNLNGISTKSLRALRDYLTRVLRRRANDAR